MLSLVCTRGHSFASAHRLVPWLLPQQQQDATLFPDGRCDMTVDIKHRPLPREQRQYLANKSKDSNSSLFTKVRERLRTRSGAPTSKVLDGGSPIGRTRDVQGMLARLRPHLRHEFGVSMHSPQSSTTTSTSTSESEKAVRAAIVGNLLVFLGKAGAAMYTSSGVLFAEALHSAADVINQSLLMIGIRRAQRRGDAVHPYGYGPLKPAFALISATGVFFLGCGVSIQHGISQLCHGNAELGNLPVGLSVIAFSLAVEGMTCYYAWQKVRELGAKEGGMSVARYVREGRDTCAIAVLVEDAAAVTGLLVAGVTLALTQLTGWHAIDAAGTLAIGGGMGALALFLIDRNLQSLLGNPLDARSSAAIASVLKEHAAIKAVHDVKTITYGPNTGRFKAEIEYDGRQLTSQYLIAASAVADAQSETDGIKTTPATTTTTTKDHRHHLHLHDHEQASSTPLIVHHLNRCECGELTTAEKNELLVQFGSRIINELAVEVDRVETDIISKTGDEVVFVDLESHASSCIQDDPVLSSTISQKLRSKSTSAKPHEQSTL